MATSNTAGNNQQGHGQGEATIGVGGATSGQSGATPAHESMTETGGNGGAQLTHSHGEIEKDDAGAPPVEPGSEKNDRDSDLQSGARGAQDTRPNQGGGTGTGIGSRESGANQSEGDLPPR